jgi:hypothetical protein
MNAISASRTAVEHEPIDHGADHHAAPHEVADRVAHVLVVPPEPIDPTDHQGVASAQLVVQAATLGTLGQPGAEARHAVVGDHLVDGEARCSCVCSAVETRAYRMVAIGAPDGRCGSVRTVSVR